MTKVLISPRPDAMPPNHGIGRVIHAQFKHLPKYGIEFVNNPDEAEVIACHTQQFNLPRVDCLMCHGLYWTQDKGSGIYTKWHSDANFGIVSAARRARVITVPSNWVAEIFKRDMRITPHVIGHGVDASEWSAGENGGYILWNKNRGDTDVCDPRPAWELAMTGAKVVSTFSPRDLQVPGSMTVTGALAHESMREMVRNADVYLATVKETFGIGTLEAMACGVPVLGYAHGGTRDLVRHEIDGYLAEANNLADLRNGLDWIRQRRDVLGNNARERALTFTWERVAQQYAALYQSVAHSAANERKGVSVVVVSYNYGRYLAECLESLLAQSYKIDEIVVVDDGSTDDTGKMAARYKAQGVTYIRQSNQGVAYARNHGISVATQPFIICLDADDKLHPRYVEVCRAEMLKDRALGVVYTGLEVFTDEGVRQRTGWPPEFDWEAQATVHNPPSNCVPSAAMFRRSMWERAGGYKQEHKPAEDTEFWTRGLSVGFTAKRVTDSPWFIYRSHPGSASRTNKYSNIDAYLPWMRDKQYPLAAPSKEPPSPRSYSTPKVSVIIPVGHGHEKYLPQAIDSLLGQTMREWECIVIDDTLPGDPIDDFVKPYPFVNYYSSGGTGTGYARNEGAGVANAPLVFFLDADDYLHPQALSQLCKAYAKSEGRYVYGDWMDSDDGMRQAWRPSPTYNPLAWVDFDHMEGKHIVSVLMATEDARKVQFDTSLPFWEDWDFFARCAIAGIHGQRIAEPTLIVRRTTGTRTKEAFDADNAGPVLSTLRTRYSAYSKGTMAMAQCCGGNGASLLAARAAYDGTPPDTMGLTLNITTKKGRLTSEHMITQGAPEGGFTPVRLEFSGERQGAVTYRGLNGREYRGGNNALERYANVHPDDVGKLTSTGDWRVVAATMLSEGLREDDYRPAPPAEVKTAPLVEKVTEPLARNYTTGEPEEVVQTRTIEVGDGTRVTRKRVVSKKEKESTLLDLPE